ncbi:MAG: ribbon-helix-helix domain-containing protein [Coriobacteriia bacterium]
MRKQIVIEPEQDRALEARAKELGVSQSSLIREAIDAMLEETEARLKRQRAWEAFLAASEKAARDGVGSGGQKWTREELHERR